MAATAVTTNTRLLRDPLASPRDVEPRRTAAGQARACACLALLLTLAGCALPFGSSHSVIHTPTATPRPLTPDELAARIVATMALDDKLGQLLIVQFSFGATYTPEDQQMITTFHPGGVELFGQNMGTAQQLQDLLASAQHDSPVPLFTLIDEEGGLVDRLAQYFGPRPGAPQMAASGSAFAQSQGAKVATDLLSFGFNVDLAPYLNLASGPSDPRSFGASADQVTTLGGAWLTGLQTGGVIGCAKTFPGTAGAFELAPYRALIASGELQMVMSSTELIAEADPTLPAALSPTLVTGTLRGDLRFTGVAITDTLYARAVISRFTLAQAAVMAIEAGNDMIIGPYDVSTARAILTTLKAEVEAGKLSQQQVDASVTRILALKLRYHILSSPTGVMLPPVADGRAAPPESGASGQT